MDEMERALFGMDDEATILADIAASRPSLPEPIATGVAYEAAAHRIVLTFPGGVTIGFAPGTVAELADSSEAELAQLELSPGGSTLTLRERDVDIALDGLLLDLLDVAGWKAAIRAQLNREVARIKSEARSRSARENGKKGGRPRRAIAQATATVTASPPPE